MINYIIGIGAALIVIGAAVRFILRVRRGETSGCSGCGHGGCHACHDANEPDA